MRTAATEPLDVNVNGNVSVGKELTVSGNVALVDFGSVTDTLFVDSVNDRVGIGTTRDDESSGSKWGTTSRRFKFYRV
jgi:hypothetical protein